VSWRKPVRQLARLLLFQQARFFFIIASIWPLDIIDTLLKGKQHFIDQGRLSAIIALWTVGCLIAGISKNERFHAVWVILFPVSQIFTLRSSSSNSANPNNRRICAITFGIACQSSLGFVKIGLILSSADRSKGRSLATQTTISHFAGSRTEARVVLVTVTDGQHAGRGEAVPIKLTIQTTASVLAQIESIKAKKVGSTSAAKTFACGAPRNALDCALWDLEAKNFR